MRVRRLLLVLGLAACGARTGIDLIPYGTTVTRGASSSTSPPDATTFHGLPGADSGGPRDATSPLIDPCPSAVLARSPLPMLGNCSTRDGRSRVVGPKAPHVTWKKKVPAPDASMGTSLTVVGADASGSIYMLGGVLQPYGQDLYSLTKVDGATGDFGWSTLFPTNPAAAGGSAPALFLLASSVIDAIGPPAVAELSLDALDPATGRLAESLLGSGPIEAGTPGVRGFNNLATLPVIGADGSFYLAYTNNVGPQIYYPVVSRIRADGAFVWTSRTDYPMGLAEPAGAAPATLALGRDDAVIVAQTLYDGFAAPVTALTELDPATGSVRWTTSLAGSSNGNPAVAPDGSIAVVTEGEVEQTLDVREPMGALRFRRDVAPAEDAPVTLFAIGLDGTFVLGGGSLLAVSGAGDAMWTATTRDGGVDRNDGGSDLGVPASDLVGATLDESGTVVATYLDSIVGLDLATGATLWTLDPPEPVTCIASSTLTSSGGLVATECANGGATHVFGAGD